MPSRSGISINTPKHFHPLHLQRVASEVVERLHLSRDLYHRLTHGVQAIEAAAKISPFDDAGAVADGDEFHGLAVLLHVRPTNDD
jgi:hypothetical protein